MNGYGHRAARYVSPRMALAGGTGAVLFAALGTIGFRLHELVPFAARILKPAAVLGPLAIWLVFRRSGGISYVLKTNRLLQLVLAMCIVLVVGIPFALVRGFALERFQGILPLVLLFLSFAIARPDVRDVPRAITMFVILGGGLGGAALLLGHQDFSGRISVTQTLDSNDLAAVLAMVVPLACGVLFRGPVWQRFFALAVSLICGWAIIRTGSRGGVLGLAAGLFALVVMQKGAKRVQSIVLLTVALSCGWQFAPESFRERIRSMTSLENDYNTYSYYGRQEVWRRGVGYGLSNPLLGVGVGNFEVAEGATLEELGRRGKWSAAHNSFVQVFAELGFPGLFIFLAIVSRCMTVAWRWRDSHLGYSGQPALMGAVVAFFVSGIFISGAYSWAFFSLCGLMALAENAQIQRSGTLKAIRSRTIVHKH